ncbi:unnamed protein product [Tilletia controversa]|nr:unnamed protein product [Tilletia controversa]CAD6970371.1 unnamed protein product [Tilletia controversa]
MSHPPSIPLVCFHLRCDIDDSMCSYKTLTTMLASKTPSTCLRSPCLARNPRKLMRIKALAMQKGR